MDQDLGALEVGHLYKATKTVDEKYITGIEDVELKDNTVNARGDGAFWLTTVEDAKVKYDVDDDTVFVYVDVEPRTVRICPRLRLHHYRRRCEEHVCGL